MPRLALRMHTRKLVCSWSLTLLCTQTHSVCPCLRQNATSSRLGSFPSGGWQIDLPQHSNLPPIHFYLAEIQVRTESLTRTDDSGRTFGTRLLPRSRSRLKPRLRLRLRTRSRLRYRLHSLAKGLGLTKDQDQGQQGGWCRCQSQDPGQIEAKVKVEV